MSDNLTARIDALEARGYELTAFAQNTIPTREELELLTALEQAQADIDLLNAEADYWSMGYWKVNAIGAARLKLAEKRIAELHEQTEWWKGVLHRTNVEWMKDATKGRVQEERAEQAEAALAAERAINQPLKDQNVLLQEELAAEREKLRDPLAGCCDEQGDPP